MKKNILTTVYQSPCGPLLIGSFEGKICLCDWIHASEGSSPQLPRVCKLLHAGHEAAPSDVAQRAIAQLDEYFGGQRCTFDLPLLCAGTPFQQSVWNALTRIPYGETQSYAELAKAIGRPQGARAVAHACAANAISIVVPCHRVIGSNNRLTGYAGGMEAKRKLLEMEFDHPQP